MKRLNGMDAMLLYSETPNLHTHTLKVAVIDASDVTDDDGGPYRFDAFRRTIARRLHLLDPLGLHAVSGATRRSAGVAVAIMPASVAL